MRKINMSKKFLIKQYVRHLKTMKQIAYKIGHSYTFVRNKLIEYNIKIRNRSEVQQGKLNHSYIDGRSLKKCCCIDCKKEISINAKRCSFCAKKEVLHPNWCGGKEKYKERYRERNNQRQRQYNKVISNRLKHNLRTRLYYVLKGKNKSKSTMKLLGCSIEDLKQYIEKQFVSKMTWNNYGKYWEIDHIRPCVSFDLSKKLEQEKCFYYTNLQPLTITQNRSKSNKLEVA